MRYAYSAPTVPLKQEKICKRLKYQIIMQNNTSNEDGLTYFILFSIINDRDKCFNISENICIIFCAII